MDHIPETSALAIIQGYISRIAPKDTSLKGCIINLHFPSISVFQCHIAIPHGVLAINGKSGPYEPTGPYGRFSDPEESYHPWVLRQSYWQRDLKVRMHG